ncbi:hypothetical protein ACERK3_05525 [Phycisphaerales bacterium AB-hyl4]|uniref:Uncharacterized protein n=1 Tax=Natronomicrosphaera hydrolytica TaxID=3242702 RepID=A0ABV4U2D6_9BACT
MVAVVAQQLAAGAPLSIDWVNLIRSGAAGRKLNKVQGSSYWLRLYRDPDRMRRVVRSTFWPDGMPEVMPQMGRFLEMRQARPGLDKLAMLDDAPPAAIAIVQAFINEALQRMYFEHLSDLAAVVADVDPLPEVDMDKAMTLPEVQFCMLVVVPAMLEYGESPTRLYAKARRGDRVALDKLLRLDKTVLGDPAIGRQVQRFGMERDELAGTLVAQAYLGHPDTSQERANVKARLAAHIVVMSESLGHKLRPVDVRRLFDAMEKDRTGDPHAIDADLPDGEEAWRQAVHRAKRFWDIHLDRDKVAPAGRHAHLLLSAVVSDSYESEPPSVRIPMPRPKSAERANARNQRGTWLRRWFDRLANRLRRS